jgi:hypothetical protein
MNSRQSLIVKVQLPITTNQEVPHMFIYNKDRSVELFTPVTERFANELKKFPHKGYYKAVLVKDGVRIGDQIKAQDW